MIEKIAKLFSTLIIISSIFLIGLFADKIPFIKSTFNYIASGEKALVESLYFTPNIDGNIKVWFENEKETHNGLILLTYHFRKNPAAILVDRNGKLLHSWDVSKNITNPDTFKYHNTDFNIDDSYQTLEDAYLLENGDLLTMQSILELANYRGQRLARLDKDSNVLWEITDNFHHDFFLDKNSNIYTLTSSLTPNFPTIDFTSKNSQTMFLDDIITVVSPAGKILAKHSITQGFANSEFSYLLPMFELDLPQQKFILKEGQEAYDILHTNYVQHISQDLSTSNDLFEPGDFLISMRGISTIAIYRPSIKSIVWATRGAWNHQHYVRLRKDGKIYIYDNDGGSKVSDKGIEKAPRIIAYDTNTQKIDIIYHNPEYRHFESYWRGYYKELNDGSYIVTSSEQGRILQVSKSQEVVWELRTIEDRETDYIPYSKKITSIKYYEKDELNFLIKK